jgi:iron complex outermembrane receptor protein
MQIWRQMKPRRTQYAINRRGDIMKSVVVVLCGVSLSALAATVHAQTADSSPGSELTEIVVTAQRRAENVEDVPITITNLTAQQLADVNATSLADISQLTPALRFDNQGPFTQASIRGVGTHLTGSGVGSNVGTYIDGFYIVNPLATDFQLLDVSNVEVLKGPQGTLFGRNTEGGAILVTTSKPSYDTHAVIEGSYGRYNASQVNFYGTTGITDHIAVDIAAVYAEGDGYTTDISTGNHDVGEYKNGTVRVGLLFDVTKDVSVLFRYTHADQDDPSTGLMNAATYEGVPQTPAFTFGLGGFTSQPNKVEYAYLPHNKSTSDAYQLTASWDLHFATLTSYSQYRNEFSNAGNDLSYSADLDFHALFLTPDTLVTQEFLLSSEGESRLKWTGGFFYFDQNQSLNSLFGIGDVTPTTYAGGSSTKILSYAAFGDAEYEVIDNLFLTAGVRYSDDETTHIINTEAIAGLPVSQLLPNLSSSTVTPRAVIRYQLSKGSNVYFSFSQGFKAQVPDLGDLTPVTVKPEKLTAYEVGYKYAGPALKLDLSTYYYDWKDIQVTNLISNAITHTNRQVTRNAAAATIYGFDGQSFYDVTEHAGIDVAAAYTHARYDTFDNSPTYTNCFTVSQPLCPTTSFAAFGDVVSSINAKGLTLPSAPDITASVGAYYHTGLAGGKLALSADYYYSSRVYFDTSDQYSQGAYNTLALRAQWTDPSDRYTFAIYGDNLTNDHYRTQILEAVGVGQTWSAPLTFGGSIRIKLR